VADEQGAGKDKASLLNQLRIDRSEPPSSGSHRGWWIALMALVGTASIIWYLTRPSGQLIRTAVVQDAGTVALASTSSGTSLLDASGYVVARRRATVASKVTGKVVEVSLEEGQKVAAGDVIARLDDSNSRASLAEANAQLQQAQASFAAAQMAYNDAQPIFERSEKQKKAAVISAQSFDEAHAQFNATHNSLLVAQSAVDSARAVVAVAQRNLDDTVVRAPFSGVVTEKAAQPGEMVSPISAGGGFTRTGIGTIVDMDSLEVEVDVSENFINRVSPQQPVSIKLNAYPDWQIPGSVIAAIPTADRSKATVKVRIAIKEKDPRIIPEMGARVSFLEESRADAGAAPARTHAVSIPPDAVMTVGNTTVAFLVHNNTVERRAVRLGAQTAAGQIVVAGLETGNTVAVGELAKLRDGAKIRLN
jgi:RND family efflux transporter MFP subunit